MEVEVLDGVGLAGEARLVEIHRIAAIVVEQVEDCYGNTEKIADPVADLGA